MYSAGCCFLSEPLTGDFRATFSPCLVTKLIKGMLAEDLRLIVNFLAAPGIGSENRFRS